MCNRYGYLSPVSRLVDEFSRADLRLGFKDGAVPNIEPREHIRPTNFAPIVRPIDAADPAAGVELVEARWWLVPFFHKKTVKEWKPMCTNARAETAATTPTFREPYKRRRALIVADHWFEWTGPKSDKVMWRFDRADAGVICFAGLWDRADTPDGPVESFTILTCPPGDDCLPYHTRQPVVLEQRDWAKWLDLNLDAAPILRAGAAQTIAIERASERLAPA